MIQISIMDDKEKEFEDQGSEDQEKEENSSNSETSENAGGIGGGPPDEPRPDDD